MGKISLKIVCTKVKMPGRLSRKVRSVVMLNKPVKYTIDLAQAMEDEDQVIDPKHYVNYLKTHLKPGGKKLVDEAVTIESVQKKVNVVTTVQFGKRYLKYLTKKYLKAQDIISYLRVISDSKLGYKIKFIDIAQGGDQE